MNKKNYQKIMEDLIRENCTAGEAPSLLLHSCCAPCSSYCIACLAEHFHVTVFYYNPNIYPPEEYHMRAKEQERFIAEFPTKYPVSFVEGAYDTQRFYDMAKGMEEIPEGGERCFACYRLRLSEAASYAKAHGFDFFTTTLSISPLKNAEKLNQIGQPISVRKMSEQNWQIPLVSVICFRILKRRKAIKSRPKFLRSITCTGSTTVGVCIPSVTATVKSYCADSRKNRFYKNKTKNLRKRGI